MTELRVVDNPGADRYEIYDGPDMAGFAQYRVDGGSLAFTHTVVEARFEGRGVGSALAKAALEAVRGNGGSVLPYCSFIRSWIQRHPAYLEVVPLSRRGEFGLLASGSTSRPA